MTTEQILEAAKSLAREERIPVSKAAKYVHQFHSMAFPHVYKVIGGERQEAQQWYIQQRELKKMEWTLRPLMQKVIAVRQQRAKIITALSA